MKSPNLVSLSSSDNINNITFGDLDILDANSTKLVAGQSSSGISYEDIEGHLFESFISKNINVGDNYSEGVSITNSEIRLATDLDNYYDGTRINNNSIRIGSGFDQAEIGVGGITVGTGNSCALVGTGWMNLGTNIVLGTGVIQAENIYATDVQATNSHFNGTVNTNLIIASRGIQVGSDISLGTGIIEASGIKCDGGLISAHAVNAGVAQIDTAAFNLSISTTVQTDYITVKDEGTGKLSIKNANNIALEILRTSANSRVYMPLLGYTSNLNYTSLHACGGIFVGDQYFSAVENKYYPELSLHTHSGAWIHNIFSRSNMYRLSYAHKNNSDLSCTITIDTDGTIGGDAKIANQQDVTYQQLYNMRSNQKLIPGRFYRITDYVTTTMQKNTRSAEHQFDVIVKADSNNTLSETAWAAKHSGDTYFQNAKLEAWELKYNLDNVQWSQQVCTVIEDSGDSYTAFSIGTVDIDGQTYILWDASEFEDDYDFTRMVSLTKEVGADMWIYYPATGEKSEYAQTSINAIIGEYTDAGKGTITWMKDEWNNIAGYDFKNIQQKRWKMTDELERDSLNGKYLGVLHYTPAGLVIEDEEDFIWAYLYSVYDYTGSTQNTTDHSLSGRVHDMDTNFTVYDNNAFVWSTIDCDAYDCRFSGRVNMSSFSEHVEHNSFSGRVESCSFSGNVRQNSFSGNMGQSSFSGNVEGCLFSGNIYYNSFSGNISKSSFSGDVENSSFSKSLQNSMITGTLNNSQIKASDGASGSIVCLYTLGYINNKTITVPTNVYYPTYVAMTTAGQLKIWNPADLVQ